MNYEKIEGRRKGFNVFCCDEYKYSKNNEYKTKITCGVFSTKKDRSGAA